MVLKAFFHKFEIVHSWNFFPFGSWYSRMDQVKFVEDQPFLNTLNHLLVLLEMPGLEFKGNH